MAVHRSKDEEDQMLRSLDRVEVCQFGTACGWVGGWVGVWGTFGQCWSKAKASAFCSQPSNPSP